MDSQSFAALLKDVAHRHQRQPLINHGVFGRFSITKADSDGTWKWIAPHRTAPEELYDLATDPEESKNVLEQNADIAASLKQQLTDIVRNGRTTAGAKQNNDTGYWEDLTWMTEQAYAE